MLLFVPTLGIAFSDVLVDALMIEVGKPRNLTGRLQSVQWFAASLGLLCSGVGRRLSHVEQSARNRVSALRVAVDVSLVLTLVFVREPQRAATRPSCARPPPRCAGRIARARALTICAMTSSGTATRCHTP